MSLKNLHDISSLVTNNLKLPPFEKVNDGSKYLQLLAGIAEDRWENEETAEAEIYGKALNSKTFDMLKSRAKEHLVNMIFQLDTEKRFKSSYDKAYYKCCKNLLAGLIIRMQGKSETGIKQINLALRIALKHHFTDLSITCLRTLRYISSFSGSEKDFKKHNLILKNQIEILQLELKCEEYDEELIIDTLASTTSNEHFVSKAKSYYEKSKKYFEKHDTYTIRLIMYRLGLRYYDATNNYKMVSKVASDCIFYLNNNPHLIQKVRLGEMNLNKLHASLQLGDYLDGNRIAKECSLLFNPGHLNWLIYLETYFLLCIQTGKYEEALSIYNTVVRHSAFNSFPSNRIEQWKVYEAYLSYIYKSDDKETKKFNVYKFLNEVPNYSKDKAGYNVTILIAQILLLLKTSEYDKIISRAESLKMYVSRHVKRENSPRTYYFLKMLLVMIKYDFDPEKTEKIAQKFHDRMEEKGADREIEEMEIIPYDTLWQQVLNMLESKKHEHIVPNK